LPSQQTFQYQRVSLIEPLAVRSNASNASWR
jgi:hypothetical protein